MIVGSNFDLEMVTHMLMITTGKKNLTYRTNLPNSWGGGG